MSVSFHPEYKAGTSSLPEWLTLDVSVWNAGHVFEALGLPPDTESVGKIEHWRLSTVLEQLLYTESSWEKRHRLALIVGWCIAAQHDLCWA